MSELKNADTHFYPLGAAVLACAFTPLYVLTEFSPFVATLLALLVAVLAATLPAWEGRPEARRVALGAVAWLGAVCGWFWYMLLWREGQVHARMSAADWGASLALLALLGAAQVRDARACLLAGLGVMALVPLGVHEGLNGGCVAFKAAAHLLAWYAEMYLAKDPSLPRLFAGAVAVLHANVVVSGLAVAGVLALRGTQRAVAPFPPSPPKEEPSKEELPEEAPKEAPPKAGPKEAPPKEAPDEEAPKRRPQKAPRKQSASQMLARLAPPPAAKPKPRAPVRPRPTTGITFHLPSYGDKR